MKRNLLFNQATAIGKRLAMVLTMLLIVGIGQALGETYTKISSLSDLTTGDYVIVGYQKTSSYGRLISGTLNSKRLTYTSHYTSAPNSHTTTTTTEIWHLDVSGTGTTRTVTIYNANKEQYLNPGLAWSNSSVSWNVSYSNGFSFEYDSNYLGVNKSSNYWRSYASSTLTSVNGIILLKAAASCDKKVTINKGTPSNGSFSISKTGTYETCDAPLEITLSDINPSAGYQFSAITQSGINSGVIIDQMNKKVTYTQNSMGTSTINVTFVQKQNASIVLSEAEVKSSITGKYVGDSYILPETTTHTCGDKIFVGWSKVEIEKSVSEPTTNFYNPGASVTLVANQTFYAVYAESGDVSDKETTLVNFTGGTQSDLTNLTGISANGLGTDYAESNAPYRVKLDNTGDYILYTNESKQYISQIYLKVKMIGGANTSTITLKTSDDDTNYTTNDTYSISGNLNTVQELSIEANTSSKYIQLYFTKGSNVGLGLLVIYAKSLSYQNYTTQCTAEPTVCVIPKCGGDGGGTWLVVIEWFATF